MTFNELKAAIEKISILLSEKQKEEEILVSLENISSDFLMKGYYPILDQVFILDDKIYLETRENEETE